MGRNHFVLWLFLVLSSWATVAKAENLHKTLAAETEHIEWRGAVEDAQQQQQHLPSSSYEEDPDPGDGTEPNQKRIQVASFRPSHVDTPMIIGAWIIIAGLTKIGFHVTPKISLICPESCLLIVVGVIIGLLLFYAGLSNVGPLTPNIFFLYMLPPIVLDAGYFMPNRPFFDNLATILLFAVLGTVFNALAVGVSLWAVGLSGLYGVDMPLLDTLLFSSIACAVDPIAVLAVFEEIHVNEVLYILVFGESLLNDAVTVVLYHTFENYAEMGPENILAVDYLTGTASFFVVAFGGTVMGIFWGLLAAFVSRFTHHVRVIEPLFVFVMSYLSYLSAELFHFSAILSLTFCGMTMKNYVEENISYKSHVTVKYAMKMLASSSETIIFLFLGVSTVNDSHEWNTWFVVMTLVFCTLYRILGVVCLTGLANRFRLHRINKVEQFIMAYGGLRGAVAFALVLIVSEKIIPTKNIMVTTIIALVFFTVFVQGMTIGPLVRILNVKTSSKQKLSMNERIIIKSMDHMMAAIEDVVGQKMGRYHLRDKFKYYNNKYLRPLLTRDHTNAEPKIFETYSKLNLADAMDMVKRNNSSSGLSVHAEKGGGGGGGLSSQESFSSLFQATNNAENKIKSPDCDIDTSNVDVAEMEYSPSKKDIADAELHHILADAMTRSARRRRSSRIALNQRKVSTDHQSSYSQWRPHARYFSYRQRSRRYHSSKADDNSEARYTGRFLAPSDADPQQTLVMNSSGLSRAPPPCLFVISPPQEGDDDGIFFSATPTDTQCEEGTENGQPAHRVDASEDHTYHKNLQQEYEGCTRFPGGLNQRDGGRSPILHNRRHSDPVWNESTINWHSADHASQNSNLLEQSLLDNKINLHLNFSGQNIQDQNDSDNSGHMRTLLQCDREDERVNHATKL